MDAELGNFIEIFVMVFLPLAFAVLLIGNRLNGLDEEIKELKNRISKFENKRNYV